MRPTLIILLVFVMSSFVSAPADNILIHRFIVQPASKLTIDGKTNLNKFTCATTHYFGKDTLILIEGSRRKPFFKKGYVGLDASSFDCGMNVITSDFGKTIKSKEYPSIFIEFISFERLPNYAKGEDKFKGKMKISLGGVTKTFQIDCTIEPKSEFIHLNGGRNFTFSDFDLKPPTKAMGLIKVNDAFEVNFHLVLLLDQDS